jgi:hypothetical protein
VTPICYLCGYINRRWRESAEKQIRAEQFFKSFNNIALGEQMNISCEGSSRVAQVDLVHGKRLPDLDLSRPKGDPDITDIERGKEIPEIIKLECVSNPDRSSRWVGMVVARLETEK